MDKGYNGWTNYPTWRVMLEVFDGMEFDDIEPSRDACKDFVQELLDAATGNAPEGSIFQGWVSAWLSDVNWDEIAEAVKENGGEP